MKKLCLHCYKELEGRKQKLYCSNLCQQDHAYRAYITRWLACQEKGQKGWNQISGHVRRWLFERRASCWQCGWDKKHASDNKCPLEVDHIDGDSNNNRPENLRLLCPNCHALTPTYKNRNKGHGRHKRRERYHAGKSY